MRGSAAKKKLPVPLTIKMAFTESNASKFHPSV
jgi:hypothetical protein